MMTMIFDASRGNAPDSSGDLVLVRVPIFVTAAVRDVRDAVSRLELMSDVRIAMPVQRRVVAPVRK
jgi:hypothetical protein